MALSPERLRDYTRRLLLSRMRLLCSHGFYGLLLLHMQYSVDEAVETACTDGVRITFGTAFLDELTDDELDFVMMHEVLHVVLQHCLREGERDPLLFNIACDIVVNSNILLENKMDARKITLASYGEAMHLTPNKDEGHLYTAEQVYEMLKKSARSGGGGGGSSGKSGGGSGSGGGNSGGSGNSGVSSNKNGTAAQAGSAGSHGGFDDHSRWGTAPDAERLHEEWCRRLEDAVGAMEIRDPSNGRGLVPAFAVRLLKELRRATTDWRTILNEFVQEEIADYSFSPPDHRFEDSPFFLPDFNGTVDTVKDVLFMIDTSGSVDDKTLAAAFSEVKGAIDQFDGRLSGRLGFFDAAVTEPLPFENEEELLAIRPVGGGGTSFDVVFRYVRERMETPPSSIVILTDGYAPFPDESAAAGIPVLWLLTTEDVEPPFGKVAHITL